MTTKELDDSTVIALADAALRRLQVDGKLTDPACANNTPAEYATVTVACQESSTWALTMQVDLLDCNFTAELHVTATDVVEGSGYYKPAAITDYTLDEWTSYTAPVACPTVVDIIEKKAALSFLRNALDATPYIKQQLQNASKGDKKFTFLLPSNTAIEQFAASIRRPASALVKESDLMATLLVNGMFSGKAYTARTLKDQSLYTTAGGETLQVTSSATNVGVTLNGCAGRTIDLAFYDEKEASNPVRAVECPDPRTDECNETLFVTDDVLLPIAIKQGGGQGGPQGSGSQAIAYDSDGSAYNLIAAPSQDAIDILNQLFPLPADAAQACKSLYMAVAHAQEPTGMWRQLIEKSKANVPLTQRAVEGTLFVPTDAAVSSWLQAKSLTLQQVLDSAFLVDTLLYGHSLRSTLKPMAVANGQRNTTYGVYPEVIEWSTDDSVVADAAASLADASQANNGGSAPVGGVNCPTQMAVKLVPKATEARVLRCVPTPCTGYVYVINKVLAPEELDIFLEEYPSMSNAPAMTPACSSLANGIYYRNDTFLTVAAIQYYAPQAFQSVLQSSSNSSSATLLAITDNGWLTWAASLNASLTDLFPQLGKNGTMQQLLQYHLLPGQKVEIGANTPTTPRNTELVGQTVTLRMQQAERTTYIGCGNQQAWADGATNNARIVECNVPGLCVASMQLLNGVLIPNITGMASLVPPVLPSK